MNGYVPLNVYLGSTSWLPHTPLYRRRLSICIGRMEGLRCWQDWEYGVRALCCDSQPGWNKKTLAYWRVKQDISRISTSAKISKESTESMLQACKQVWRTIPPEWRRDPEYRNAIAKRLLNAGRKQWAINRPASQEMLQWAFRISESPNDRLKIRMMQAGLRVPGPHLTNWLYDSCNKLTRS